MQAAGGAVDWLERCCAAALKTCLYDGLFAAAAAVPPGANGLLFLPYLLGERSPYWNPLARGAFVGLTMAHSRPEMARAVLEGVAFNLRLILDSLRAQQGGISATFAGVRLIGGGARSPLWRQILADVFGAPILLPALVTEATSLGAAIAGGVGVGLYPDFSIAQRFVCAAESERPDPTAQARYTELLPLFGDAYRALEPIFTRLT